MGKILKYLGRHKLAVIAIFLLLTVQAYCDARVIIGLS